MSEEEREALHAIAVALRDIVSIAAFGDAERRSVGKAMDAVAALRTDSPVTRCDYCEGEGFVKVVDYETNEYSHRMSCDYCKGKGTVPASTGGERICPKCARPMKAVYHCYQCENKS